MADEQESQAVEQPAFDPSKFLAQVEQIIKNNSTASTTGSKSNSLWSYVVIIAVFLIGLAAWSWYSWARGRELAKLRHEKETARILAEQAEVKRQIADNDAAIAETEKALEKSREALRLVEADIRAEEARHEADLDAIRRITTWDESYRRAG